MVMGVGCQNASKNTQNFSYTVLGHTFKSPIELPLLVDVGAPKNTAMSIGIPGQNNNQDFEIVFFDIPATMRESMTDTKQALLYGKSTYLATAEPSSEESIRTFFGKENKGEKQTTTIPEPSVVESYLVQLPSGKWLFLGVRYKKSFPVEKVNTIMNSLASSLQE
jgi:hypothetical protein